MSTEHNTDESITITVLKSGLSLPDTSQTSPNYSTNRTAYRGEVVTFTSEEVESTRDLNGNSFLELDEEAQTARWGAPRFAHGDVRDAEGIRVFGEDDIAVMAKLREQATKRADLISDPEDRRAAHAAIRERFGAPQTSQRTLQSWEH